MDDRFYGRCVEEMLQKIMFGFLIGFRLNKDVDCVKRYLHARRIHEVFLT